jgi:hypothetical protein
MVQSLAHVGHIFSDSVFFELNDLMTGIFLIALYSLVTPLII